MKAKLYFNAKTGRMLIVFALTLLLTLAITPAAHAGEVIEGRPDAVLEEGETVEDDLFITGNQVLVAGTVEGDLFATGEEIVISGDVYGNVFAAGTSVTVSGTVDGALLFGGYDLTLEDGATIRRNVYFGGFSFQAMSDSLVNRSIYGGGYQMILDGTVAHDITAGLGALKLSGPVGGDVNIEIGEPTTKPDVNVIVGPGTPVVKVLDPGYEVEESLVDGDLNIKVTRIETDFNYVPDFTIDPAYLALQQMRRRFGEFVALMLVGMLGLWLMKDTLLKAVQEVKSNVGMDTVWGIVVYLLYIPVVLVVIFVLVMLTILVSILTLGSLTGEMITLGSFTFFGLTGLFGIIAGLVTKVIISYLVGRWLLEKASQLSFANYWHHVGALAIGVFLYEVLRAIPLAGFMVMLLVVVIGTGALFVLAKNALQKKGPAQPSEVEFTPV